MLDATDNSNPEKYVLRINPYVLGPGMVGYKFQTKSEIGEEKVPLTFDNKGNVGIGTTRPLNKLHIHGNYLNDGTGGFTLDATDDPDKPEKYVLKINPFVVADDKVGYKFQTKSHIDGEKVPLKFDNAGNVEIGGNLLVNGEITFKVGTWYVRMSSLPLNNDGFVDHLEYIINNRVYYTSKIGIYP